VRVGASERTLTPERVVVHRKYKGQSGGHDLALMKLPSAKGHCLTFDPNTNAACLSAADTESGGNAPSSCVVMVTAAWTGPGMYVFFFLSKIRMYLKIGFREDGQNGDLLNVSMLASSMN